MQRTQRGRLPFVLLTAVILVAAATGIASANRLSLSEQTALITWDDLDFASGLTQCDVSLRATFHARTFSKSPGNLVGHVTDAAFGACGAGTDFIVLRASLPWNIQYDSFTGTLPAIRTIRFRLLNFSYLMDIDILGIDCLYQSSAERPLFLIANLAETGTITGMRADETPTIPLFRRLNTAGSTCPAAANFSGTGALSTTVRVSLI